MVSAYKVAELHGLSSARFVEYSPPNISIENPKEIHEHAKTIVDGILGALTEPMAGAPDVPARAVRVGDRDVVFGKNLAEVNEFFRLNQWTDGLPIMPPTLEAVDQMLLYTDRAPDEVIGKLPPANGEATVWGVAVNGVMAGCRPEYMPVLLAVTEAIAEPGFGLQHAGSTAGWTPLIILNGPIGGQLDFNAGLGVLRPEKQANITVARFLRLVMVNVARYLLGVTDMATFGCNYIPVLAEAEDRSPYEPLSVDRGFRRDGNVVTIMSAISMGYQFPSPGSAEEQLRCIAAEAKRELGGPFVRIMTIFGPEVSPLLCLSPMVASMLSENGYSKGDIRQYIYDNARISAAQFDEQLGGFWPGFTVRKAVEQGKLPEYFCETDDPERLLPVLHRPDQLLVVVSGFWNRSRNFIVSQCGDQGLAVSREISLPANWEQLLENAGACGSGLCTNSPLSY